MAKKVSKDIEDKAIELYVIKKQDSTKISKELGIGVASVLRIVKRNGYEVRKTKEVLKGRTREKIVSYNEVIKLYTKNLYVLSAGLFFSI